MASAKITGEFKGWSKKYASSDVIIVGGGPAGLMAALDLARLDLKILVVESSSAVGGRLWASDFLISTSGFMPQVREILDELKVPYKKGKSGLSVTAGSNLSSKLISAVCDAGVRILNMAEFKDLIFTDEKVEGITINWVPQLSLKDKMIAGIPTTLKSQAIIDATGLDARVCRLLMEKGAIKLDKHEQIDVRASENMLLEKTGNIYPGLAVAGMAVAGIYGIPQGGLTLCSMLLSGRRVADEVIKFLSEIFYLHVK
ncbi:MAG: sulfide-dependent adenosine diphosphate thiazole synthase [Candidatus Omnitrophota bacterium]|nr:sulfide-dependent adenosine diphosphate thiazole synthase [Candidatus Omnitrophota bacterium]